MKLSYTICPYSFLCFSAIYGLLLDDANGNALYPFLIVIDNRIKRQATEMASLSFFHNYLCSLSCGTYFLIVVKNLLCFLLTIRKRMLLDWSSTLLLQLHRVFLPT